MINRQDDKGKIWTPGSKSRVCSNHFDEGVSLPAVNLGYKSDKKLSKLQPPKGRRIDYQIDSTKNGNPENEPTTAIGEPEEPKTQSVSTQIENLSVNEMKLMEEVALLKETIKRKNQRISKLRNYVLQLKSQAKEKIMSVVKKSAYFSKTSFIQDFQMLII